MFSAVAAAAPPDLQQTLGNLAVEQALFKTMVATPYHWGVHSKELLPVAMDLNTCSFRSVHIQPTRAVEEIMVDEIARRLGRDPLAFRLEYLRQDRARAVLQRAASAANWGRPMPAGFAQGLAVHQETRSYTAAVVEVDARDPQAAKVVKATIVVDVGKPINLSGIHAQLEGGLADAIGLMLNAGLSFRDGAPIESSYTSYRTTKMSDFPRDLQIIVMPNVGQPIGGLGEVGLSAASGAIANAWARATGLKPRKFPLNRQPVITPVAPGRFAEPVFVS